MSPRTASACGGPIDDLLDPVLFRSLCDPTRAKLLACLIKCARPCTVSEIAECCVVDLSVVSRHLKVLESAGVLSSSRRGREVSYAVQYGELCRSLRDLADAIDGYRPRSAGRKKGACCDIR